MKEIEESVQAHYRRCTMFEVDDSDDSDEDMSDDGSGEVVVPSDEGEDATDSDEAAHGSWTGSEVSEGYIDNGIQHISYALVERTALASRQRRGHNSSAT